MGPRTILQHLATAALLSMGAESPAQQLTYTQDLTFQTVTPATAQAGIYQLYPYGPAHFVAKASQLPYPADYAVYDSLGQATGQHFRFHLALPSATPIHFGNDAVGAAYIAGIDKDSTRVPAGQGLLVIAKYLPNGIPDSTWGQNGIWVGDTVPTSPGGPAGAAGLVGFHVYPAGDLILIDQPVGSSAASPTFYLRRINPVGQLDVTFGVQGSIRINPTNRMIERPYFAADGSTYACVLDSDPIQAWGARWRPDGSLDTTFRLPHRLYNIYSILPDGRIISYGMNADTTLGLRRHWANGAVDNSYTAAIVERNQPACALPGGGWIFTQIRQNSTPYPDAVEFTVLLPDGTKDPTYMPAALPMLLTTSPSFWPPPNSCHPFAYPGLSQILAIGSRRIILSDFINAYVPTGGGSNEYENITCPRVISLVTDLQTVGQPEPAEASALTLWPNPVSDHFSLRIPTRAKSAQVQLYDLAGKVLTLPSASLAPVAGGLQYDFQDLADLPSGLYLLRVTAGSQQFVVKLRKD